jgi:hypothetical protein
MPTSQNPSMLSELAAGLPIPLEKRAYFHARVLNGFYQYVLAKFLEEEGAGRITKAELARRLEKRPEVITRLLGAAPRNYQHAEWLKPLPSTGASGKVTCLEDNLSNKPLVQKKETISGTKPSTVIEYAPV